MQAIIEEFISFCRKLLDRKLIKVVTSAAFYIAESILEPEQEAYQSDLHSMLVSLIDVEGATQRSHNSS